MQSHVRKTLETTLARLRAHSVESGEAPADVADYAVTVTRSALRAAPAVGLERRAESYYQAVVRRRLVRRCGGTAHAARLVVGSVVADLIGSGRTAEEAWEEVARGWGHLLTPELSQEFHDRLCA